MLAFNQAPSSWRRLIIILATATTMAVMGVSSASSCAQSRGSRTDRVLASLKNCRSVFYD